MGRTVFLELLRDAQLAHGLNVQPFWIQTKVRETSHLNAFAWRQDALSHKADHNPRRSMHDSEALCSVGSQEWTHLCLPQLAFHPKTHLPRFPIELHQSVACKLLTRKL